MKYLRILLLTSIFFILFSVSASAQPLSSVTSHKYWFCINYRDSNGKAGIYACGWDSEDGLVCSGETNNSYWFYFYNLNNGVNENINYYIHMKDSFMDDSGQTSTPKTHWYDGIGSCPPYTITSNCVIYKTANDLINKNTANSIYIPNNVTPQDVATSDWGNPPQRSTYADGIIGDVEYGFDTFIYYVTIPFKMLASAVTQLVNAVGIAINSLTSVQGFLTTIFGYLPSGVSSLLVIAVGLLVVGLVLHIFRR